MTDTGWIRTFTGRKVYPLDPACSDPAAIQDIAHALALTNRFAGHTAVPYSVADHSLRVASLVMADWAAPITEMYVAALYALMHDAAEAYLCDVPRPIKRRLFVDRDSFATHERRLLLWIYRSLRIGVPPSDPDTVEDTHIADEALLAAECRDLMYDDVRTWNLRPEAIQRMPPGRIVPREWQRARDEFITMFQSLRSGLFAEDSNG